MRRWCGEHSSLEHSRAPGNKRGSPGQVEARERIDNEEKTPGVTVREAAAREVPINTIQKALASPNWGKTHVKSPGAGCAPRPSLNQ